MQRPARFWKKLENRKVQCTLCPRECVISPGKIGVCKMRKNVDGELCTLVYGSIVSTAVDPIEKKPLYHFWPGSRVFSIATAGCNFTCDFCQNYTISQNSIEDVGHEEVPPEELIELTKSYRCNGVAFTYSEPSPWWEYCYDVAKLAHREGLYAVYVTNGYMSLEAWEEIQPYIDAANVDVKALSDSFYQKFPGVPSVQPVLDTCEWAVENGIHLEVTNLIIPGENDNPDEIRELCRWVANDLDASVPVHFSRFHPMYKMIDKSSTPVRTLEKALEIAREEELKHVYIGNVPGHEADNTYCPECGELLIRRRGFSVTDYKLEDHNCPKCSAEINIVGEYTR